MKHRILVGITGASGVVLGIRVLEALHVKPEIETHLILTKAGERTIAEETDHRVKDVKGLATVAYCNSDNLLTRAADVMLKERRRLVLVVRETPLHTGHLKALLAASEAGAVVMPPLPGFYNRPKTLDDLLTHLVARIFDQLDIEHDLAPRWGEAPTR
jgi:4-hydroxy-3-polyprenylbenzoate decarboxylase